MSLTFSPPAPRVHRGLRAPGLIGILAILLAACAAPASPAMPTEASTAPPSPTAAATPVPATLPVATSSPTASPTPPATSTTPPAVSSGSIPILATDAMRFEPGSLRVRAGEPITFVVTNSGVIRHEFVVGDEAEQAEHAAEMAHGSAGHGHGNALSLAPGETGTLVMQFDVPGRLLIGCHEPGHYAAGMVGEIEVID
jgi:uncharacterized cupredoxin-like copper-binding protein